MTEWLHFHFSLSCVGEGYGDPLQCSCLENPRDGGAWWAAVYGVAQSRTRLKRLSSSSSFLWWTGYILGLSSLVLCFTYSLESRWYQWMYWEAMDVIQDRPRSMSSMRLESTIYGLLTTHLYDMGLLSWQTGLLDFVLCLQTYPDICGIQGKNKNVGLHAMFSKYWLN